MTQYARVLARTTNPTFIDIYGQYGPIGGSRTPVVGERGYMEIGDAEAAAAADDVYIHVNESPFTLDKVRAGLADRSPLKATVGAVSGAPDDSVTVTMSAGPTNTNQQLGIAVTAGEEGLQVISLPLMVNQDASGAAARIAEQKLRAVLITSAAAVATFTPAPGTAISELTAGIDPLHAVVGAISGTNDDPVTVTFSGGPGNKIYKFKLSVTIDNGDPIIEEISMPIGQDPVAAASAAAGIVIPGATLSSLAEVTTVTPGAGTAITALNAVLA